MTDTQKTATHFFASFAFGWSTAETEKEAIEKLLKAFRGEFKTGAAHAIKDNHPGAYFWVCEVNAPADTAYSIEFFQPKGMEILQSGDGYVTRVTAKEINYFLVRDIIRD